MKIGSDYRVERFDYLSIHEQASHWNSEVVLVINLHFSHQMAEIFNRDLQPTK